MLTCCLLLDAAGTRSSIERHLLQLNGTSLGFNILTINAEGTRSDSVNSLNTTLFGLSAAVTLKDTA
jgi:hypothetical protein